MNIINPYRYLPLSLISTMKHEWYFQNVQNPLGNIITIPDTGTIGGLDLSNVALANKPTQSTIGSKISYSFDGTDDYLYVSVTDFLRYYSSWMIHIVVTINNGNVISFFNEANALNEGWRIQPNNTLNQMVLGGFNSSGVVSNFASTIGTVTNGQTKVLTIAYNGTNTMMYNNETLIYNTVTSNIVTRPTTTSNIAVSAQIKPLAGNSYSAFNQGYIGVDEYNATRLANNITTLKSKFGIL